MRKDAQTNWDDLRFVLAVADRGSVAAAARALGVNHATVLRRIAAFETRHALRVFEKTAQGYRILADRRTLVEAMRSAGDALGQVERLIDAERPRLGSGLRVTSTDTFCQIILPPIIAGLSDTLGVTVDVLVGNTHLDFGRLQADMTGRPTARLPDDLDGVRAGEFRFAVFGAPGGSDEWLGLSGAPARSVAGEWLERRSRSHRPRLSADSFTLLATLAALGRGRALLPVFLGDDWPGLERLDVPEDIDPVPLWVATHVDLAKSGRLRRACDYLVAALQREAARLSGQNFNSIDTPNTGSVSGASKTPP